MNRLYTLDIVNKQLLKAVDIILTYNRSNGIALTSDSAMGKIISPSYPSLIKEMRKGARNLPHKALLRFVATYPYDMNYFYKEELDFIYPLEAEEPERIAKALEVRLTSSLEDFFFKNPAVSPDAQGALITLKEQLTAFPNATSIEAKSEVLDTVLNGVIAFVARNSQLSNALKISKGSQNCELTQEVDQLKMELIHQQKDYKTLSQKYVSLLEKALA